jgi:hypothetical protein
VRRVHRGLGKFVLQIRQAHVETGSEALSAASCAQVHFGVNGQLSWESDLPFAGRELYRTKETGRPTGGEKLLGVGAVPGVPGDDSLTSSRPSSVRETPPCRPPVVWALAVYNTFSSFV